MFSNNDIKLYFGGNYTFPFFIQVDFLHLQRTNKQPINIRYNDVKNFTFTSILSFCIGPKCVFSSDDTKDLFLCELQFSLIFTSRPLNH